MAHLTGSDLAGTAAQRRAGVIEDNVDVRMDVSRVFGLRRACGKPAPDEQAVAGELVQYSAPSKVFILQTAIEGFAAQDADRAFREERRIVNACTAPFVSSDTKQTVDPEDPGYVPRLPKGMSLIQLRFANPDSGATVHDAALKSGQFVYQMRIVNGGNAAGALTELEQHGFLNAGLRKFKEFLRRNPST
jgi:hypothetical protein